MCFRNFTPEEQSLYAGRSCSLRHLKSQESWSWSKTLGEKKITPDRTPVVFKVIASNRPNGEVRKQRKKPTEVISPGTWKHQGLPHAKERILTRLCACLCGCVEGIVFTQRLTRVRVWTKHGLWPALRPTEWGWKKQHDSRSLAHPSPSPQTARDSRVSEAKHTRQETAPQECACHLCWCTELHVCDYISHHTHTHTLQSHGMNIIVYGTG